MTRFTRWSKHKEHAELVCLHPLPSCMQDVVTFRAAQSLFLRFATNGLENLELQQEVTSRFTNRCAICNHFHSNNGAMKTHWCTMHPGEYEVHDDTYQKWVEALSQPMIQDGSCIYCRKEVKQRHDCIVLRNLALLATHEDQGSTEPPPSMTPDNIHQCEHCQKLFRTSGGLQMHMAQHHASPSPYKFVMERDVIPGSTACSHCGRVFESMTTLGRHIRLKLCTEFDANRECETLMDKHHTLANYIQTGNCEALLKDATLLEILSNTCGICQQEYSQKGNLIHHINTRHGTLTTASQNRTLYLEDRFRGTERTCFCGGLAHKKQLRTHKCVVFLQFAMLEEYHRIKTAAPPALSSTVVASPETPTELDDLPDDSLARMLQTHMPAPVTEPPEMPARREDLFSFSNTPGKLTEGTFEVDIEALPFMDMPTYSQDVPLGSAVLAYTHSSFLIAAPRAIDHIAKGDYLALWKDLDALHFMSRQCVCCGCTFTFDGASKHLATHWGDITNLPDGAYPLCAEQFLANFLSLPWFQDIPCHRAVLHQVLILRLLIDLWNPSNGDGRLGDAGYLEECLETRRHSQGLQKATVRNSATPTEKGPEESTTSRSRSRRTRHSGADTATGKTGDSTRRRNLHNPLPAAVHPPHEEHRRFDDSALHEGQPGMASARLEATPSEVPTGTALDGYTSSPHPDDDAGGEERRRVLQSMPEAESGDRRSTVSVLELESPAKEIGDEQRQTFAETGAGRDHGGDQSESAKPAECPSISRPSTTASRSRSPSHRRVSMGDDSDTTTSSATTAALLSQHLATRGCGSQAPNGSSITTSEASGNPHPPKALRILWNRPKLYCWMNSVVLGLCWLGLVLTYPETAWCEGFWPFMEVTRMTPVPLALYHGDSTFQRVLSTWDHNWDRQHDAVDLLCFLLPLLIPAFYTGKWLPRWAVEQPESTMAENDEQGSEFSPVVMSIFLPVLDFTLQDYVSYWHDLHGHQRTFLGTPRGTCIQLDRNRHDPPSKDQTAVYISDFVCLPCYYEQMIHWVSYQVVAVTYHTGHSQLSGHWQTSLWQGHPFNRWMHYDDGVRPIIAPQLNDHIHQNWVVVWLALDPTFD